MGWAWWEMLAGSACAGCGGAGEGVVCGSCRPRGAGVWRPVIPGVSRVIACGRYVPEEARALRAAKYHGRREVMVALAASSSRSLGPPLRVRRYDAVVPVPSPPLRRWGRGFQPTWLLAEAWSPLVTAPICPALGARSSERQATRTGAERRAAGDRFVGRRPVEGRVLLVDDVVTTGSTVAECARELRKMGATEVDVVALYVSAQLIGEVQIL